MVRENVSGQASSSWVCVISCHEPCVAAHARATAVLLNELDAGKFENTSDDLRVAEWLAAGIERRTGRAIGVPMAELGF